MSIVTPEGFALVIVDFNHTSTARSASSTFGVATNAGDGSLEAAEAAIRPIWQDAFGALIDTDVTMTLILRQGEGDDAQVFEGIEFPGENPGAFTSSAVALLVRKATARAGRSGRGRMYIPWIIPENALTEGGVISNDYNVTLQNTADAFLAALDGADVPMYLLHSDTTTETTRTANSKTVTVVPRDPPPPTLVTSLDSVDVVATQRRRQRG